MKKLLLIPIVSQELDNAWTGQYRRSLYTTIYNAKLSTEVYINSADKIIVKIYADIESKVRIVKTTCSLNHYMLSSTLRGSESYNFNTSNFLDTVSELNSDNLKMDTVIPRKGMYHSIKNMSGIKGRSIGYMELNHSMNSLHEFIKKYNTLLNFDDDELSEVTLKLEKINKIDVEKRKEIECDFCGRYASKGKQLVEFHDDFYDVHFEKKGNFCRGCFSEAHKTRGRSIDLYVKKHNDSFKFNRW